MNQYNGPLSYKLSSERAHQMIKRSELGQYQSQISQFAEVFDFMNYTDGQQELFQIIDFLQH